MHLLLNQFCCVDVIFRIIPQCFDDVGLASGRASGLLKFCNNNSKKFTFGDRPNPE